MLRLARSSHIEIDLIRRELYFYQGDRLSRTYPVAIGKPATPSPVGEWTIINKKILNYPSIFGTRWMGLSNPGYGIHGTNNSSSIGKAVSLGCIRMYNHNIEELFKQVSMGTKVIIYKGSSPNNNQINYLDIKPSPSNPKVPLSIIENQQHNSTSGKTHEIKAGDTLWDVSQKLNIPLHQLVKANPKIDPNNLQIGQMIILP